LIGTTDVLDALEDPGLGADLDKGSENGGNHLNDKGCSRGNLDIVAELEILDKGSGFCQRLHRIGFEDHVGERVSGQEGAGDDLSENIEGDALSGHGVDEAGGEDVDDGEDDGEDESPDGDLGVPDFDGDDGQTKKEAKGGEIPPVGDLWIVSHEFGMDVICLDSNFFEAVEEGATVVEDGVDDDAGAEGKGKEIGHGVSGREVEGRVIVVGIEIKSVVWTEDAGDVVDVAEFVVGYVGRDGKVGELPDVGVVKNGSDDPVKKDKASEDVELSPPGDHEGTANPADLGPVKGEEAHAEARVNAKELIEGDVVWGSPADEGKDGKGLKEIAGEEEEEEGGEHEDDEEAVPCDALWRWMVGGEGDIESIIFVLCMEGVEEGAGDEILWPDHASRPYEESPAEASKAEASELCCEDEDG